MGLGKHTYGEEGIRLLRVDRRSQRHEVQDLTVAVRFEGDFEAAFVVGDNRQVLPPEAMRNTVFALAREHPDGEMEALGRVLAEHFLRTTAAVRRVRVELQQRPWERSVLGDRPQLDAFSGGGPERRRATVERSGDQETVLSGILSLRLLKTRGADFGNFARGRFTPQTPVGERTLAVTVDADWRYGPEGIPYGPAWHGVRRTLVETFADHHSHSVQHTLHTLGEGVLANHEGVDEIRLKVGETVLPAVDLSPFGLDNPRLIFDAAEHPHGVAEGVLRRKDPL